CSSDLAQSRAAASAWMEPYENADRKPTMAAMTPAQPLLQRIAEGDRRAVDECIDQYSGLIWSLARRFLRNEADAEEAVQEIFIDIWTSAGRFDATKSAEATFVSLLARRRLIDRARHAGREPPRDSLDDHAAVLHRDDHLTVEADAESRRVMRAIDALNTDQQQVLRMSTWLGMSHAAIAETTAMPLGTVKSHLRRGLAAVRKQLGIASPSHLEEGGRS
ncbi:MAG: sigma-70 family RNA polymerase sigma factor, partial [Pseudomonadota bacterium]